MRHTVATFGSTACAVFALALIPLGACSDDAPSVKSTDAGGGDDHLIDAAVQDARPGPIQDARPGRPQPDPNSCLDGGRDAAVFDQTTADGSACDLRKTHHTGIIRDCLPIAKGDYCSDLGFCIPADRVSDLAAIAPDFECRSEFGCQDLYRYCSKRDVENLDDNVFSQMCAVSVSGMLVLPHREIECVVYE